MDLKPILFFAAIIICLPAHSQDMPEPTQEDWEMMTEFMHEMYASVFQGKGYAYKETPYVREDFFNTLPSAEEVNACLQRIRETGQIAMEKHEFGPRLTYTAELTPGFRDLQGAQFEIELEALNLSDEKGRPLQKLFMFYNYSSGDQIEYVTPIDTADALPLGNLSGSATYSLRFLIDYGKATLKKEDIGKTFSLNDCDFKLIDIVNNQVVIESLCEEETDLSLINFANDSTIYASYSYEELLQMKEEDESINTEGSFNQSRLTIPKTMYDLFRKKPTMTLKAFRKRFPLEEMKKMKDTEPTYILLEQVAPIGEKFVVFAPKYQWEKVEIDY